MHNGHVVAKLQYAVDEAVTGIWMNEDYPDAMSMSYVASAQKQLPVLESELRAELSAGNKYGAFVTDERPKEL